MPKIQYAHVNEKGEVVFPPQVAREPGITPGDEIQIEPNGYGYHVHPSIHQLKRVYVETTNICNLSCSTCMRNVWHAQYGQMSEKTFEYILLGPAGLSQKPELCFGGYGEPLSHPNLLGMFERAKKQGYHVSLITNGILLTKSVARQLIDLHLDMLWVSLDGASSECYSDVRLGDSLPTILQNLSKLRELNFQTFGASNWSGYPKLGIAFVAMQRNIHDLGEVIRLGTRLGAVEFSISNMLAHNSELLEENLYMRSLDKVAGQQIRPIVHMTLMDVQPKTVKALSDVLKDMDQLEHGSMSVRRA